MSGESSKGHHKQWHDHGGTVLSSVNGFDVIDCAECKFKHVIPIPTEEELEKAYRHEYYTQEKPLYLERYRQDLEWWNTVYTRRYELLEQNLSDGARSILDIGSGPGFFLLNGQQRGWRVKGIEPSIEAATHSQKLGLDVENIFFSEETAPTLGTFDVINMGEVLEHIPAPADLLKLAHSKLNVNGLICIIVPNDFNPFQEALEGHLGFSPWWVAPPHHINYFDFPTLAGLLAHCGFEVLHQESTFPIDLFLLMGDNYVGNDALGRACHTRRMNFEKAMVQSGRGDVLTKLYTGFANQNIGREVVMFARAVK
ncbi:bifunctional 2-polyprenyl-6-hydroxyphenol methylase/3-demethylubiquinol 3-O-methyltransferase UbiG [Aquabacterium sp. CECT 9606]|uniref:class I SAM-dependent methyltransferase n=1 Tax=Aquabacterium sp. CECT 9606 TaxID=2845822 RepID=UPI001E418A40|nr:class I SAM-dependent methyltransferase [Aquabacterium sp. CECT 9606]CAH0354126.1 Ubiquinone biosynthesis O-methyltransferase, mitochondrial [Aquabacterium sp. CECT 9606]